jgi:hypothetical protein
MPTALYTGLFASSQTKEHPRTQRIKQNSETAQIILSALTAGQTLFFHNFHHAIRNDFTP